MSQSRRPEVDILVVSNAKLDQHPRMDDATTSQELGSLEPLGREWQAGNELYRVINVSSRRLYFF